jgi:hypothetical protein
MCSYRKAGTLSVRESFLEVLRRTIAEIDASERKSGKVCKVEANQVKVT